MNLDYTEEQKGIKREIAKMLAEQCPMAVVRRVVAGADADYDQSLWATLGQLGWLAAGLPESCGGLGLNSVVSCGIAEELGRVLAPVPVSSSIHLAAGAIDAFGSPQQKRDLLPGLGSGSLRGTFALWEVPGALPTRLNATVHSGRLFGIKWPVADGATADIAVIAAVSQPDLRVRLYVADLHQGDVRRERLECLDPSRPMARLEFTGARAEPLDLAAAWDDISRVLDKAAVLASFEQIGGAERALEQTLDYAKSRSAFGRPIGGFQAIKHRIVDVYMQIELAKSNAYYAAWALNTGSAELPLAAAAARVSATRAFELAAREMVHVHGGFGMTWESDCHLFYRRSRHLASALGAAGEWRNRVVSRLEIRAAKGQKLLENLE